MAINVPFSPLLCVLCYLGAATGSARGLLMVVLKIKPGSTAWKATTQLLHYCSSSCFPLLYWGSCRLSALVSRREVRPWTSLMASDDALKNPGDSTAGKAFAFHVANAGLIPGIPNGPLNTTRCDPKPNQRRWCESMGTEYVWMWKGGYCRYLGGDAAASLGLSW